MVPISNSMESVPVPEISAEVRIIKDNIVCR